MRASVLPPEALKAGAAPSEEEPCRVGSVTLRQQLAHRQRRLFLRPLCGIHVFERLQHLDNNNNSSNIWFHPLQSSESHQKMQIQTSESCKSNNIKKVKYPRSTRAPECVFMRKFNEISASF